MKHKAIVLLISVISVIASFILSLLNLAPPRACRKLIALARNVLDIRSMDYCPPETQAK